MFSMSNKKLSTSSRSASERVGASDDLFVARAVEAHTDARPVGTLDQTQTIGESRRELSSGKRKSLRNRSETQGLLRKNDPYGTQTTGQITGNHNHDTLSGHIGGHTADLNALIEAWTQLPDDTKAAILKLAGIKSKIRSSTRLLSTEPT